MHIPAIGIIIIYYSLSVSSRCPTQTTEFGTVHSVPHRPQSPTKSRTVQCPTQSTVSDTIHLSVPHILQCRATLEFPVQSIVSGTIHSVPHSQTKSTESRTVWSQTVHNVRHSLQCRAILEFHVQSIVSGTIHSVPQSLAKSTMSCTVHRVKQSPQSPA
jgi:hypothetical protein